MILGTTIVPFTQNAKKVDETNKDNQDALDKLNNKVDSFKTNTGTTIYQSTQAPDIYNPDKYHDGDIWYVQDSNHRTIDMFTFSNGAWTQTTWDAQTLNVQTLSSLTANLGTVNSGTLNAVNINGAAIYVAGDNAVFSGQEQYWLDKNGFHEKYSNEYSDSSVWIERGTITFMDGAGRPSSHPDSSYISSDDAYFKQNFVVEGHALFKNRLETNNGIDITGDIRGSSGLYLAQINVSGGNKIYSSNGDIWFREGPGDNENVLHASAFKTTSNASLKKNIEIYSGKQALAEINSTDIASWYFTKDGAEKGAHIGPIIDDVNEVGEMKYQVSKELIDKNKDGVSQNNAIGLLMAGMKEQSKQISDLSLRVAQLERN